MKTATLAILSNVALLTLGVLVQQTVLTEDLCTRVVNPLLDTGFGLLFPLAYLALPIAALAICIYCVLSHYRYERRRWKLVLGFSAPGLIACCLISLFNVFLCCALVT